MDQRSTKAPNTTCRQHVRLEYVQDKVVALMEAATAGIVIVPLLVVDRNSHFGWVSMVHAITAAKVLLAVEILRVVHIRVVVEAIPVAGTRLSAPRLTVGSLISRCGFGHGDIAARNRCSNQKMTEHQVVPPSRRATRVAMNGWFRPPETGPERSFRLPEPILGMAYRYHRQIRYHRLSRSGTDF